MMRFLIVFPDWGPFPLAYRKAIPPLSPAVLAGILGSWGEVVYCDERLERVPTEEHFDLVFITAMTNQAHRASILARTFMKRGIPVIMGGVHVSLMPDEAADLATAIFVGECEETLPLFLDDWKKGTIQKRYICSHQVGWKAGTLRPDRSIYSGKGYLPLDPVQFFRGCRLACEACSVPQTQGRLVSFRDTEEILDDIQHACDYLFFINDDLYFHRARISPILEGLKGMNKYWLGLGAADMAGDESFLSLLQESGCWLLYLDFGPRETLAINNPGRMTAVLAQLSDRIRRFKDAGIKLIASFTFGYDFDTKDSFDRTVDYCRAHDIDEAEFHLLVPYPGSRMAGKLTQQNRITSTDWRDYSATRSVFTPRTMSADELMAGYRRAWRRFYELPELDDGRNFSFDIQSLRAFPDQTPDRIEY